jgi:hypothetical protein
MTVGTPMVEHVIPSIARWRYNYLAYSLLLAAGLLNLLITLHSPLTGVDRTGSATQIHLLEASIALVQVGIWLVAMRGASGLMRYAKKIANTPDGEGFFDIARSLMWLIAYIVLVPLTSSIANASAQSSHSYGLIVMHNHLPIGAMIVAVAYLYRGSHRLLPLTTRQAEVIRRWRVIALVSFVFFAALFIWHFYLMAPSIMYHGEFPRFALPLRVLMFTYVLPHILAWLVGMFAIFNLWQYSTSVEGSIYRQLLRNLYQGIFLVFVCTFIAQLLTASTVTLSRFNLGVAVIYAVLVLAVVGYLLIYRGVKQLIKLEAVI